VDVADFCRQSATLLVAGKGGVGKTVVTASLARLAATCGLDVLVTSLDPNGGPAALLGATSPVGYDPVPLPTRGPGRVRGQTLTPDEALVEYLADHGFGRLARRLGHLGVLDVVATAVPGLKDILVLAKLKQLVRANAADLILLDAPATGHALSFLTSPQGLADAARVGPIRDQARAVLELLSDPTAAQVLLVTLPEETPVNETIETAFDLEDRIGVALGPVVVNRLYPERPEVGRRDEIARLAASLPEGPALQAAAHYRAARQALQAAQRTRLAEALPLPQLSLPYLFEGVTPATLGLLAEALREAVEGLPPPATAPGGGGQTPEMTDDAEARTAGRQGSSGTSRRRPPATAPLAAPTSGPDA